MPSNQLQFIRRTLYRLKHRYGAEAEFYVEGELVVDEEAGTATKARAKYKIRKVIRLPEDQERFDPRYLQFTSPNGTTFDGSVRSFIVDGRDLSGFEPNTATYLICNGQRYNIKAVEELDFNAGYMFVGKYTEGAPLERILEESLSNQVSLTQGVTNEFD